MRDLELQLALAELSQEWDFIVRVEVVERDRFLASVKKTVEAYRAGLKVSPRSIPYVAPEADQ